MNKISIFALLISFTLVFTALSDVTSAQVLENQTQDGYETPFSISLDAPMFGVTGSNQATAGIGVSLGLLHWGPIRSGIGIGGVTYINRPAGEVKPNSPSLHCRCPEHRFTNRGDMIFYVPVSFKLLERKRGSGSATYFTIAYTRAMTDSSLSPHGSLKNGVLMGISFSSR